MEGTWFSICWSPRNFNDPNSFIELDGCPRFYFSENGSPPLKSDFESRFPHLYIKEIFKTIVFTENSKNEKMPTHYRYGIFMPGENKAYDSWLVSSFEVNSHILDKIKVEEELLQKNVFLEYASKLIRHDMHSGINTYMPRGLQGLLKKIPENVIKEYKLQLQIKLLEEGLSHTKKVYDRVKNFTDLMKENSQIKKENFKLDEELKEYFKRLPLSNFIEVSNLPNIEGNKVLICTAIENFVINGINFNRSIDKKVKIYSKEESTICIEDNGVGLSSKDFDNFCKPNYKGESSGLGLGINISASILSMHGFGYSCEEIESGTIIKINL
jgi:hypothetical protein